MIHVGFDVGGTNIKAGLVDGGAKIVTKRNVPFPKGKYQQAAQVMENLVDDMLDETGMNRDEIRSIGIAIPGSIDTKGSVVIDAYNLGFHNVPMKDEMSRRFPGIPVYLGNDANVAALAELCAGAFKGCQTAVLLTLGTGVGGGIILNGRMFNGGMEHGVELGHMCLIHDGPACTCGNRGCVESVCTATWLTAQGKRAAEKDSNGLISKKAKNDQARVNAKTVIDSAKEGDPAAVEIFNQYVDYLSSALLSIVALLDPEVIALGGGVSLAGDFLFEPLRKKVWEKSFFKFRHKIVPAEMGNDAGVIGAAMLQASREGNL